MRGSSCYLFQRIPNLKFLNSISKYLDDILNIDNKFFDSMVNNILTSKLQLNEANVSDTDLRPHV